MATSTSLMRWGTYYKLGHGKLDHQHEELIDLLNHLYTQWQEGVPRRVLTVTLGRLVDAVLAHFHTEEQVMVRHHYARLASHRAEHDSFAREVTGFLREFQAGHASLEEPLFQHLASWLRNHLIVSDRPMSESLRLGR